MSYAITVDPSSFNPESWIHVLRGTKDTSIVSMTLDGVAGIITYPTGSSWQVSVILDPGLNSFDIVGIDNVSNRTETITVEVTLPELVPELHEVFDDVTKHALVLGINRLKGEKNVFLARRASDAAYYPAGTHLQGAVDGISRSLGLTSHRDALSMYVSRNIYGDLLSSTTRVEVAASHVLVDADEIFTSEAVQVDPAWPGFYLTYEPRSEMDVALFTEDDVEIDKNQYSVYSYDRKVVFNSEDYNGMWLWAQYNYRHSFARGGDLDSIKSFLDSILIDSQKLINTTVDDSTRNEAGLCQCPPTTLSDSDNPFTLNWCPVQVYNLHDERFRDSLLNSHGAAYDTLLEAWAKTIAKKSKFGWEGVILDVDMWDPMFRKRNNAVLPHLSDPYRGHWACADPSDQSRYNYSDYIAYTGRCPNHLDRTLEYVGVRNNQWHSGVGDENALLITGIDARR